MIEQFDLLPCPFCGGQAKIFTRNYNRELMPKTLYWYICSNRNCEVSMPLGEWTEQKARIKWNTRAKC